MEIISKKPESADDFGKILMKRTRYQDLPAKSWFEIYKGSLSAPEEELPPMRGSGTGLPAIKIWEAKNPLGYARATHIRAKINELAGQHLMPPENLLSPDSVRRLCWNPPPDSNLESYIQSTLADAGARAWQIGLVASHLVEGLSQTTPWQAPPEEAITQQ